MVKNKTKKVKCYKSCKNVSCNKHMTRSTKMSYCEPCGSKNCTHCNLLKLKKNKKLFKKKCTMKLCNKRKKGRKYINKVSARTLHKKMPYIWRHLTKKTRKRLLSLAKKPIKKLNIKKMKFP